VTTPDLRLASGPNIELGRLLARLREQRELKQKDVADRAEIDGSTLSRLEAGERGFSRDVLDRICAVLQLTRHERLDVLVAAGLLTNEAARFLADDELARFAQLLTSPTTAAADAELLRRYLQLALAHAAALGYEQD
jgi:transcriptional regulator with XRE-family HTH domain